jgi:hypothetical protein
VKDRKPILHGRDHACGGTDPIPGICVLPPTTVCVSWPDRVAEIATAGNTLLGLWRLGEAASPFADTSGHPSGAADAVFVSGGVDYTTDVTGALADMDDGAVRFNGSTSTGDYLHVPDPGSPRFNLTGKHSIAVWIRPRTNAATFSAPVMHQWAFSGSSAVGYILYVAWPSLDLTWLRRNVGGSSQASVTSPALTADEWTFVVCTYDTTAGHSLYVNGALVDTDATTMGSMPTFNTGFYIAAGSSNVPATKDFYGDIDELAVWDDPLTAADVAALYTSGLPCTPSEGLEGQVIVSDGAGSSVWAYPTKIDGTRYGEILSGTGITSTDNLDGTVTLAAAGTGGASPDDTASWMPLTTTVSGDDVLVFDAGHSLIPTLVPF